MRWANPSAFWLLPIVPVVAFWLAWTLARRRRGLARFCGPQLAGRLTLSAPMEVLVIKASLLTVGILFAVVALARPQWGATLEPVARRGVDVLFGIDISESMLAEDAEPNRLLKARQEALRLLERLEGDRAGLLAFAGSAGMLCPLTLDDAALRMFLDSLAPDMISYPGSSLAEALRAGTEAFNKEERRYKVMVLFSDGEDTVDPEAAETAAKQAAQQGIVIHTIGVGSPTGAPIPVRAADGTIGDYRKDAGGRVVTTRLDESVLSRIAEIGGGSYWPATPAEEELDRVAEAIAGMEQKEMNARLTTQFEERFQIPLAAAALAFAVEALLSGRRRRPAAEANPLAGRSGAVRAA
jgi:Ca-activated chloride channel family protein